MYRAVLILFLLSVANTVFPQESEKQFVQITTQSGLSQSRVKAIYQDAFGYMWFGTADGLNRYDGIEFKVYTAGDTPEEGIIHSSINNIVPKNDRQLFICTDLGVSILDLCTDEVRPFEYFRNMNMELCYKAINGMIWFGSQTGLYRYNPLEQTVDTFKIGSSSGNQSIRVIYQDSSENLWIGTYVGLALYMPESNSFKLYTSTGEPGAILSNEVRTITEDRQGRLWVGTGGGGLQIFENYKEKPEKGIFRPVLDGAINQLLVDKQDRLWVGKSRGGDLTVLELESVDDPAGLRYTTHPHSPQNQWGLSDNSIISLFEDRYGDIWIGTYAGGVSFYSQRNKPFRNYILNPIPGKSISNHLVTCFWDDGKYIWIGTGVGLDRLNKQTGDIYTYVSNSIDEHYTLSGQGVISLFVDSKNNLWVGTWNGGLNLYLPSSDTFKSFAPGDKTGTINSPHIFSIAEDMQGYLWIGTNGGGLNRFDPKTGLFKSYTHDSSNPKSIRHNSVNHVTVSSDNKILLTNYIAFEIFDPETEEFTHYVHEPDNPSSLKRGQTTAVFEDSRKNIWIAGNMGLNLFDKQKGTFKHYSTKDGLPNNSIQGILEDDHQNLWITTNKGFVKFINGVNTPQQPEFRVYDKDDGVPSNDFISRSAHKGSDGFFNLGTSRGFTRFHPDNIKDNDVPPSVIISDFRLIGSSGNNSIPMLKSININNIENIKLNYKQNNFRIHFTAINYINPKKNRYKFMLKGHESDWREVNDTRFTTYTNLNPGVYTFLVIGSNNDGVWSLEPKQLIITIVPPWWQTTLFRIALYLTLILLTYLAIQQRFKIIKQRNEELEKKVDERTRELSEANTLLEETQEEITCQNHELQRHRTQLEELVWERTKELEKAKLQAENSDRLKSAFLANLSHELRTPMNAIVGFSNLLSLPDVEHTERETYTTFINSNTNTLLTLINDILDVSLIETDQFKLFNQEFQVKSLFEELELSFNMQNKKQIEIKAFHDNNNPDLMLYNDQVRIKQVISNLISNAIKFTEKGHVHFKWEVSGNQVQFIVEDTGIGIQPKDLPHIFNAFYKAENDLSKLYRGTGLGLSLSKKIIGQMQGNIEVSSEPGKGSKFTVTIPIGHPDTQNGASK